MTIRKRPSYKVSAKIPDWEKRLKEYETSQEEERQKRLRGIEEDRRENEEYYEQEDGEDLSNDFDVVVLIRADEYYQGPTSSTRVSSFKFVPRDSVISKTQFGDPTLVMGDLYIKWVKGSNVSKFGPMSVVEYRDFTNSTSYGKAVVDLKNSYGYTYDAGSVEGLQ